MQNNRATTLRGGEVENSTASAGQSVGLGIGWKAGQIPPLLQLGEDQEGQKVQYR